MPESQPSGKKGLLVVRIDAERTGLADKLESHLGVTGPQGIVSSRQPECPPAVRVDRLFATGGRREQYGPGLFVLALSAEQVGPLERKPPVRRAICRQGCHQLGRRFL